MPKGAVLLHRTLASACVSNLHGSAWAQGEADLFFSYLPLSHIFERFFEGVLFGLSISYFSFPGLDKLWLMILFT
jgi:long-chain acyl-CoA synthetase